MLAGTPDARGLARRVRVDAEGGGVVSVSPVSEAGAIRDLQAFIDVRWAVAQPKFYGGSPEPDMMGGCPGRRRFS
jgi:hypothetical protein